jgi:hypothetical protein
MNCSPLRPNITGLNAAYVAWSDGIVFRNIGLSADIAADCGDLYGCQPAAPIALAKGVPPLCGGVSVVVTSTTQGKMGRVDATRVIASVHDDKPRRDCAFSQFVGVAMGSNRPLARQEKDAVPVLVSRPGPFPTCLGLLDAGPKHIVWAEDRVSGEATLGPQLVITRFAQPPRNGTRAAYGTGNYIFGPVCHSNNSNGYAIVEHFDGGCHRA